MQPIPPEKDRTLSFWPVCGSIKYNFLSKPPKIKSRSETRAVEFIPPPILNFHSKSKLDVMLSGTEPELWISERYISQPESEISVMKKEEVEQVICRIQIIQINRRKTSLFFSIWPTI